MENCSSIIVIDSNKNSQEIIKSFLEEIMPDTKIKIFENYSEGIEAIKVSNDSPIVIIDISLGVERFRTQLEDIKLFTSKLIITSTDYSTDSIIRAMRLGAKEFLPKPIIKEDLNHAINKVSVQNFDTNDSTSKIITIFSNKGGIGKTTIATNLAYELSKVTGGKVALIDLNLQLGDISTFLNLSPAFDAGYVIKNLVNKKDENILNAFEKYKNTNLYILSDPSYIEQSESILPQEIEGLFNALKKIFPYIIVDIASNIDQNTLKILDKSDWILFTTIVNLPAIRNAQRCLNLFKSRRYSDDKVKVIINRYMENDEIKSDEIETTIDKKIYWKIPNNYFSIMDAINKGVPVGDVASNSNIADSFRDFASKISDDIVEQTITKYKA